MSLPVRVLLVEEHDAVREGMRRSLAAERDVEVVGEAATSAEGLSQAVALAPDVVVLDTSAGDGEALSLCRQLRAALPATACLLLTSIADADDLAAAAAAGAAGYLVKRIGGHQLAEAIRMVAAGTSLLAAPEGPWAAPYPPRGEPVVDVLSSLSRQERRILDLLGEGITNREIGVRLNLTEKTVKNYVSVVLAKLGVSRRTQAAVLITQIQAAQPAADAPPSHRAHGRSF